MIKILISLIILYASLFGTDIEVSIDNKGVETNNLLSKNTSEIFGFNLFNGEFRKVKKGVYNSDYELEIGDKIIVNLWGSKSLKIETVVDNKGFIFIEGFGALKLRGKKNNEIQKLISEFIREQEKDLKVYVELETSQLIQIYLSGNVVNPGLYEGNSDDGILKYLDMAGGIEEGGSFRNISILRNNKISSNVDLYEFLLFGKTHNFLFKSGDVILVGDKKTEVTVTGEVYRPFKFELLGNENLSDIIRKYAILKPEATDLIYEYITKKSVKFEKIDISSLNDNNKVNVNSTDRIHVLSDKYSEFMIINIEGETYSDKSQVFKIGSNLQDVINGIEFNNESDIKNLMLFRKSVAVKQKKLLHVQLNNLERDLYTQNITTSSEAKIQSIEHKLLLSFIKKARKVEPKGLVVLNKDIDFRNFKIEDGDTIFIPKKSAVVFVQGQVQFPSVHTFVDNKTIDYYLNKSGGLGSNADISKILIIHKNGTADNFDKSEWFSGEKIIYSGDSIVVMQEVPDNNWAIWKDITEIVYHIAVSTGVLIAVF